MATYVIQLPGTFLTARSHREVVELACKMRYGTLPWVSVIPDEECARPYERGQFVVGVSGVSDLPYRSLGCARSEESAWEDAFYTVVDHLFFFFGDGAKLRGPFF